MLTSFTQIIGQHLWNNVKFGLKDNMCFSNAALENNTENRYFRRSSVSKVNLGKYFLQQINKKLSSSVYESPNYDVWCRCFSLTNKILSVA